MRASGRLVITVALAAAVLSACVTAGHVEDKRIELTAFLAGIEERALICAPRELAEARANLEFAVYEAGQGQTTRAASHVTLAEERSRLAWTNSQGDECEADSDLDGLRDSVDRCPAEPEDYDGDRDDDGCPDADRDHDGVDDDSDRCPDEPEDKDGYRDTDGCPDPDNDGDGLSDQLDQCPNEPEDKDGFEDTDGCPDPDNDGDGLLDLIDQCPNEPEDKDGDRDGDGCPDLYETIVVTQDRIELKQTIYFGTGNAKIKPRSFPMLNEVADAIGHVKGVRVRVEGHTDSRGGDRYNRKLSQRRADSVRAFLIGAGVAPDRLDAVGYGEDRPIDTNTTRDGRSRNRRVEFLILR